MIFSYPVQRHRLPASASRISESSGAACPAPTVRSIRSSVCTSRPGVQNPHWTAPASTNASCTVLRVRSPPLPGSSASPSTVRTSRPSAWPAAIMHEQAVTPSK